MPTHRAEPDSMVANIDVTPVVGVLLVLLTVFMTAMPIATTAYRMDRPPLDGFIDERPYRDPVYVTVGAAGGLIVGGGYSGAKQTASSPATLARDVCDASGGELCHRFPVFVRGDPDASYADFMAAMASLKAAGFQADFLNEDIE